jgi:3-methyladenine DNA glycosylase AlkD
VLRWLERRGTKRNRDGMDRFAIRSGRRFGVSMETMRPLIRTLGRDHELALALWNTGWLEARILASFVDDPARVTAAQMEVWAREFDNWAVCDGACCHLFDRTPYAWSMLARWSRRRAEFVRRAAFATLAGLAVHDKRASDAQFVGVLPLIEQAAHDDRNFVKKSVNWALRQIGKRNAVLHREAIAVAERLIRRPESSARWIGHDALRELRSASVMARLERRSARQRDLSAGRAGGR